ncbi:MAG: hypothetical protein NC399_09820 [Muribaculum sp.]|nr:hypothetical protein [Muribaculum sp.]
MAVEEDNYPDNYYSDLSSDSAIYRTVMVATEFGLVDVEAGDALRPDDAATREFVAHSFNICMGYALGGEVNYTFSEADSVTYADDIQIAINKKWFALTNGAFLPEIGITVSEKDALIAIAVASLSDSEVNENYDNEYTVRDGVIVLPESVQPLMTGDKELTLYHCTVELKKGDIFVALSAGFPIGYKAVDVTVSEDATVVDIESVELEEVFGSIDVQGVIEADMTKIEAMNEDAQISYIVGGTELNGYEDGIECYALDEVNNRKVSAAVVSREMDIPESVRQTYALPEGTKAEVKAVISNVGATPKYEPGKGAYLGVNGRVTFTCNVGMDVLDALEFDKKLAEVPIAGVGRFKVTLDAELGGTVSLNLVEDFSLGIFPCMCVGIMPNSQSGHCASRRTASRRITSWR